MSKRDQIYSVQRSASQPFLFNQEVVDVFDDMLVRSIPLYSELQHLSCLVVKKHFSSGYWAYDVGCSTGNTILALHRLFAPHEIMLNGSDASLEMIERCRAKLIENNCTQGVELERTYAQDINFKPCSVVLMNYVMQFVPLDRRAGLLQRIFTGLQPGGALLVSEKVSLPTKEHQDFLDQSYYMFKRRNGYSDLEIEQKTRALRDILVPLSREKNEQMLRAAGFSVVIPILQAYHFTTWYCVK
ncbi:MAG: methyltransferase domain-containing protein [Bdellovibrionales bacterium]|nr:methyltransferase domain-containing protein [Bdellovibrionales bacterium]